MLHLVEERTPGRDIGVWTASVEMMTRKTVKYVRGCSQWRPAGNLISDSITRETLQARKNTEDPVSESQLGHYRCVMTDSISHLVLLLPEHVSAWAQSVWNGQFHSPHKPISFRCSCCCHRQISVHGWCNNYVVCSVHFPHDMLNRDQLELDGD